MKTFNLIGVVILAPLAAIFFIMAIGLKSIQAITEYAFHTEHGIEHESIPFNSGQELISKS